jgi:uncharacterized protein (UPF0548 family)
VQIGWRRIEGRGAADHRQCFLVEQGVLSGRRSLPGSREMWCWQRPSEQELRAFVSAQSGLAFSYPDVGATRGTPPAGYTVDHNRVRLGSGRDAFERAVAALRAWRMFAIEGVDLCWPDAPIAVGTTVAIVAGNAPLWSLNACRIVYVIDDAGPPARYGFAYGTLPEHAVRGEERFLIECSAADDVHYDLLAMSQPSTPLLALARPLVRIAQRRFARGSIAAMRRAVGG